MKRIPTLAAIALAASCAFAHAAQPAGLALTHVTVVDVESGRLIPDQTVVVRGRRIERVQPASARTPAGVRVVDARGKYLVPGLWDAHTHLSLAGSRALPAYAANGVTSVRDLGGRMEQLGAWRREVEGGTRVGPRLYLAGPNLEGAWWLDAVAGLLARDSALRAFPLLETSPRYRVATPAEARAAVDSLRRMGAELIKFRNLRGDEFRALASEARRRGVGVVGHAPQGVSIAEAADSGLRSFEHMETVTLRLGSATPGERSAQLAVLARRGTAITATLVTDIAYRQTPDSVARAVLADTANRADPRRRYLSPELLAFWRFGLDLKRLEGPADWAGSHRRQLADLRLAREAGVPILVGTDLGASLVYPGFGVHDELRLLVERGGLSPLEALRGATLYPARAQGVADSVGTVAAGRRADLVLLDADPLADIANTQRIRAVVLAGRYLDRRALDGLLERAAGR